MDEQEPVEVSLEDDVVVEPANEDEEEIEVDCDEDILDVVSSSDEDFS